MHLGLATLLLVPVWMLAPLFGSPSSLWVMPTVAVLAAWLVRTPQRAVVASVASLGVLLAAMLGVGLTGGDPLRQLGFVGAIGLTHAPIVALLAAGAGWLAQRLRARRGAAAAA